MEDLLEKAYEDFALIAESSWSGEVRRVALKDLYGSLGDAADAFDNMIYDRLGMSPEEALDMFDMDATLP